MASVRIATTRAGDLQALAAAGQAGTEAWTTLHALLARELSATHAALLAEPVVNESQGSVDWYADGTGDAVRLADLPPGPRAAAQAELDRLTADIRALAVRLAAGRGEGDRFLSDTLDMALRLPGPEYVYVRGTQPVLVAWGHERSGGRGGGVVLSGQAAAAVAAMAILPPPPSPYGRPAAARTLLWGVLAASLLLPLLAGFVALRDPFGWFAVAVPQCRIAPGQLGLEEALQGEVSREGVLRAELARLSADAGARRLQCPPIQPPTPPPQQAAIPPPPPAAPPAPPPSEDRQRAERRGARSGKLQVILAWDDVNDLDLRVVCPNGADINFSRRNACGGVLDVDANGDVNALTSTPVENVYFDSPPPGRYRVMVDPYGMRTRPSSPFRITIRRDGQPDQVVPGVAVNGQRLRLVTEFTVEASQ